METSKITMKESIGLNKRALMVWWKAAPKMFISTAVCELFAALTPYVPIYFTARLIDEITGDCRREELIRLMVSVLAVTALMSLFSQMLKRWKMSAQATRFYREEAILLHKYMTMDFAAADDSHTRDLDSQIRQNRNWSGWGLQKIQEQFEQGVHALVQIAGALALSFSLFTRRIPQNSALYFLNSPLFLVGILPIMLGTIVLSPTLKNKQGKYWVAYTKEATFGNRLFSFFGYEVGMNRERAMDIRIYRQDKLGQKRMKEEMAFTEKSQIAKWARGPMGLYVAAAFAVSRVFTGVVYLFVCLKAWGGAFGIGAVTQYIGAITSLANGVSSLLFVAGDMKNNANYLKTEFEFLDIPNEMYQGSLTVEKRSDRKYEVEFKDVSFRYPNTDVWALRHVSMKFQIGERLAVVGQNGSGKTTMIKLLCRLYDPTEGEILLNGINIRKYDYAEYRNIFSVVFQDFQLLAYGLGQNVAGGVNYDADRARACLKDAGMEDRMGSLPKGLDTCIGREFDKEGVEVSGGEAQKIAIARALYKDSPFIVLDEPTAALDPVSEAEIYARFNTLIQDKTAIYISHRLSSCRFCDRIAVFDQGHVVQFGSHDQLVSQADGKYYELWQAQAQYYQ